MRSSLATFVAALLVSPAAAEVEFRWFAASANLGIRVAGVRSVEGSYFRLSCSPEGVPGEGPSLQYEMAGDRNAHQAEAVQVVVDEEAFPFELDKDGLADNTVGRARSELVRLADRLSGSRSGSFVVEVPRRNVAERFSLKDVQRALGKPGRTLIARCH